MFDGLTMLRRRTMEKHRLLEKHGIFSRMLAGDLTAAEYGDFLATLARFYGGIEPWLLRQLHGHPHAPLYRRRLPLLSADLRALGLAVPHPSVTPDLPPSGTAVLGMIYAIEGSTHGGQVIAAHCRKTLGDPVLRAMRYLSELGPDAVWGSILQTLRDELACGHDVELAASGAACVFDGLMKA